MKQILKDIFLHTYRQGESLDRAGRLQQALCMAALAVWALGLGTVCLYFAKVNYGRELFYSYWQSPLLLLLNLLPVFLLTYLFFFLAGRVWAAVLASGIVFCGPAFLNFFKIQLRNDPLLATDVLYISEGAMMSDNYNIVLTPSILVTLLGIAAATAFSIFFLRARPRGRGLRWGGTAVLLLLCAAAYFGLYRSEAIYEKSSNMDACVPDRDLTVWNDTDQYATRGFVYPLLYSARNVRTAKPAGYDRQKAANALKALHYDDIPADERVSVIGVMLEAYNDLTKFGVLDIETDPYAFFHELQAESLSGRLVTNIFAGGTIDTERAFLTGSTALYEYRAPAFSYARYFREQGYYAEFCHPGNYWFYNRKNVAEYLGFQASHFAEDTFTMPWGDTYMLDTETFDIITGLYEQKAAEGTPYFGFAVTYQNHGPYAEDCLYDEETQYVKNSGLSAEAHNILNNYLWGIKKTDDALRDFVGYYRACEEPVVLVFFGDHNPWLGDGSFVYSELGIDIDRSTDESFYDYYETPYVIWANAAAKAVLAGDFVGDGGDFSPFLLMTRLFDECGWGGNEYMKATRALRDEGVDVVHVTGALRENGALVPEPSAAAQGALHTLLRLQYYLMRDAYR